MKAIRRCWEGQLKTSRTLTTKTTLLVQVHIELSLKSNQLIQSPDRIKMMNLKESQMKTMKTNTNRIKLTLSETFKTTPCSRLMIVDKTSNFTHIKIKRPSICLERSSVRNLWQPSLTKERSSNQNQILLIIRCSYLQTVTWTCLRWAMPTA